MKKIITAVASMATFLLFGAANANSLTEPSGTSFEGLSLGEKTVTSLVDYDDSGTDQGSLYWFTTVAPGTDAYTNETVATVKQYLDGETPISGQNVPIADRPTQWKSESNSQYLAIDTTELLYRTIKPKAGALADLTKVEIGDGIYLDTLVQFSAADDQFKADALTSGDKIAIEYVEHEPDANDPEAWTNFVVRAGWVDAANLSVVETNYFLTFPDQAANEVQFDKAAWHRLTVRAISNVGNAYAPVGFIVYVDGTNLVYKAAVSGGSTGAGDETYVNSFNSIVSTYLYNDGARALLPSLLSSDTIGYDSLAAVAFKGNGAVDDISFTVEKPAVWPVEGKTITIAWDANVTKYIVERENGEIATNEVAEAGSVDLLLDPEDSIITVTAEYKEGYEAGAWTTSAGTLSNGVWTFENGAKLTINSMFPMFEVGGVNYGSFAAALSAAVTAGTSESPATIKLLADFAGTASQAALTFSTGYIVLDLNGKTIQGLDSDYSIANMGASLTIIDSASGGTIAVPQMSDSEQSAVGSLLVYGDTAITVIRAGIFVGVVTVTTSDVLPTAVLTVYGGKFYDADYDETDEQSVFYLVAYAGEYNFLPEGVTYKYDGSNYFTVSSGEEPPAPTTFALTTTGGENAEIVTDPVDVSALTVATEVTITATATNGFTYATVDLDGTDWTYDSNDDAISMTTNISENTEIAVPDAVAEQSSDDWPTGQDLDDAEGQAAGDLFPGITNALATADAKAVATWAEANNVEYAAKGSILPEAFLLNCANTQAAIDEEAANFKVTAITVVGDTVTITPADGADYGNGKVVIEGTATLSPISWHEKTDGDHFFRATLVVKPVAAP